MIDKPDTHGSRLLGLALKITLTERHEWFAAMATEFDHVRSKYHKFGQGSLGKLNAPTGRDCKDRGARRSTDIPDRELKGKFQSIATKITRSVTYPL